VSEYQEKYPLPDGVAWDCGENVIAIRGALAKSLFPEWAYGWVEPTGAPKKSRWRACLWVDQRNTGYIRTENFLTKEEAVEYLWLKFTLEGVSS